ncbi:RagB/SusD family nutrient uptake outer membrane protein [Chitinophaga sp. YR573]|uniref:RagB/SusD family nutrient uptake outer membrane protein n=1 Tax=Chitinophaga sp. YR573 TaxID=1881040 RepID=UPI0015A71731|nr:RagB/SusD family nutrient uptake outer membrane protein [Chitinophaga sp. YR573]
MSCNKLTEVNPPETAITGETVYTDDATAIGAVTGVYVRFSDNTLAGGLNGISIRTGLSSDELTLFPGVSNILLQKTYLNALSAQDYYGIWENSYTYLQTVNAAIEGLAKSTSLTSAVKKQLQGEVKFLRAFFYFYLVNLYGDVPLSTTSDYRTNATNARTDKADVYKQIVSDLIDAQNLLTDNYIASDGVSNTPERVRPNKWTATALLARVYLYTKDWAGAETQSTNIINAGIYNLETDLNKVFLNTSTEAIWQLMPVDPTWNTYDARSFILTNGPDNDDHPVYLSSFLLTSFESNDLRRENWIGENKVEASTYYYPYKYKSAKADTALTEYTMIFRLAEQYLIRAEARAQQENITGGLEDLNKIRTRAGLVEYSTSSMTVLISAIMKERRVELFTEWGHRWLDMKRNGTVNDIMNIVTPLKGGSWSTNWQLYPVPYADIKLNPRLKQNDGY